MSNELRVTRSTPSPGGSLRIVFVSSVIFPFRILLSFGSNAGIVPKSNAAKAIDLAERAEIEPFRPVNESVIGAPRGHGALRRGRLAGGEAVQMCYKRSRR
ncbi:hypothetical protein DEALK_01250 [Dehalogenimonas alkenigignens]|uniref:Uncharacterized protein n=1 Tax=Dehalogenimonas alkenigignens TaxID=1217799 RepID=A0A0W0GKY2_9CHLR|nr:hypothetical protein DEALK_01250 [Dehalogenimonas alkenigignens]